MPKFHITKREAIEKEKHHRELAEKYIDEVGYAHGQVHATLALYYQNYAEGDDARG